MDTLRNLFGTLFTFLLCATPFLLLIVVAGGVAFLVYDSRKKRAIRLQNALHEMFGLPLPEIDQVLEAGINAEAPLTQVLLDGA